MDGRKALDSLEYSAQKAEVVGIKLADLCSDEFKILEQDIDILYLIKENMMELLFFYIDEHLSGTYCGQTPQEQKRMADQRQDLLKIRKWLCYYGKEKKEEKKGSERE